jgi:uncharacterized protein YktB (UPF0637 family)
MWKRYAYGWLTLAFFLVSIFGHWIFGWLAFVDAAHVKLPVALVMQRSAGYVMLRD